MSFIKYQFYWLSIGLHWLYWLNIGLLKISTFIIFYQYLTNTNQYILETNIIGKFD